MVGSPVVPRVLSVPGSSVSLTVMHPDWFPTEGYFEISLGFLKMVSGSSGRLVASVSIECANMGIVAIGGIGIGWDEGLETLYSLGRMGKGVHYSYHKQRPQFSEGVDGPTGPAPNSTKG